MTGPGIDREVAFPSPSWPHSLLPQQKSRLPLSSAQAWVVPMARLCALLSPITLTGVKRFSVLPSPRLPSVLAPQQRTEPLPRRAHAAKSDAAISTTPLVNPVTCTGALRARLLPSPSCPTTLEPQQCTDPAWVNAQENDDPDAIWMTGAGSPLTRTGLNPPSVVAFPSPSWPD